jgi:uncharacterized protein with PIN domain
MKKDKKRIDVLINEPYPICPRCETIVPKMAVKSLQQPIVQKCPVCGNVFWYKANIVFICGTNKDSLQTKNKSH